MGCRLQLEINTEGSTTLLWDASIFNDIAEVVTVTTNFSQVAVLSYPPSHIIVVQMMVATSRICCFTLGSPCPIIVDRGFHSRVAGRSLNYDEVCCLSPLMCQCNKGRTFRCQALDRLHDSLEPHDIEIRIQVLDHSIVGHLGVGCLSSPNGGISTGAVVRWIPDWIHHEDQVTLFGRVPASTYLNLRVVIRWILVRCRCRWGWTWCSNRWPMDRRHDQNTPNELGGADIKPCTRILTRAGTSWCRWAVWKIWSLSISRHEVLWCWP
jgi:hypothetical protein